MSNMIGMLQLFLYCVNKDAEPARLSLWFLFVNK